MIPLLVLAIWILVLALVAGLCVAARGGDVAQLADTPAAAGWASSQSSDWGQTEQLVISARSHAGDSRAAVESDAPLLHSGGSVAA
jgi:hypothetical protein